MKSICRVWRYSDKHFKNKDAMENYRIWLRNHPNASAKDKDWICTVCNAMF